jgi:hypothetical protein
LLIRSGRIRRRLLLVAADLADEHELGLRVGLEALEHVDERRATTGSPPMPTVVELPSRAGRVVADWYVGVPERKTGADAAGAEYRRMMPTFAAARRRTPGQFARSGAPRALVRREPEMSCTAARAR